MSAFQPSDAWLFLAVARSNGSSLSGLLSAADHINHGLPTFEETSQSLMRLHSAGLVTASEAGYRLTRSGRELFVQSGGFSVPAMHQVLAIGALIQSMPMALSEQHSPMLTRALFDFAVRSHRMDLA